MTEAAKKTIVQKAGGPKTSAPKTGDREKGDGRQFKAGMAVGIGSAAIVAALLYARSGKARKK